MTIMGGTLISYNINELQALVIPECCYRGSRNLLMAELCT
jgi:hypothetical protein